MENVRILLRTLNDPYLGEIRSAGAESLSGPAEGRRVPCEHCKRHGQRPSCPVCDGSGWRRRQRGEPAWDEYVGSQVAGEGTKPRDVVSMSSARIDAELTRLQRSENESYGWERHVERLDATTSRRELKRALELLRDRMPLGYHLLHLVYLSGLDVEMDGRARAVEQLSVAWLAETMRGPIRIPLAEYKEQRAEREADARRLAATGMKPSEIASTVGLSVRRVKALLPDPTRFVS